MEKVVRKTTKLVIDTPDTSMSKTKSVRASISETAMTALNQTANVDGTVSDKILQVTAALSALLTHRNNPQNEEKHS